MSAQSRLFQRFPFLFFVVAIIILANNKFLFSPNFILQKPYSTIVPLILIGFGVIGYVVNFLNKKRSDDSE